jgi:hypothetical protein
MPRGRWSEGSKGSKSSAEPIGSCDSPHLRVEDDLDRLLLHCALVNVDGANSISVAHHGDPRVVLNTPDESVAAARDDEVDVAVLGEEGSDLGARRDGLDVGWRESGGGEGTLDDLGHDVLCMQRFLATLEDGSVACE